MFTVQPFEAKELGNASFVVADTDTKQAVVIDPVRDVDQYLTHAEKLGLDVTRALDTHTHNDFVSGARELKALAGTAIDALHPDEEVRLGSVTLRAMYTPGHTPDHRSYVLIENGTPKAMFSGGAVMVGGTARTDLFGPHMAAHLALESLRTLQVRLRGLPDDVAVYPTHGSGSFCGISGGAGHETTLGQERMTNPYFTTTEVIQFLARILDQHRYPDYYADMGAINTAGAPLLGRHPAPPRKLKADETAALKEKGAAIIDIRRGRDYDRGHIPGSYSVSLIPGEAFSAWVGWLIARTRPIVLVGGSDQLQRDAQTQLHRIGFDNIARARRGDGGVGGVRPAVVGVRNRDYRGHGPLDPQRRGDHGGRRSGRPRVGLRPRPWRGAHVRARCTSPRGRPAEGRAGGGALRSGVQGGHRGQPARAGGAEEDHPRQRALRRLGDKAAPG